MRQPGRRLIRRKGHTSGLLHETGSIAAKSTTTSSSMASPPPVSFTRPAPLRHQRVRPRPQPHHRSGLLHETGSIAALMRRSVPCWGRCAPVSFTRPAPLRRRCVARHRLRVHRLRSPSRDRLHCGTLTTAVTTDAAEVSGLLHETGSIAATSPPTWAESATSLRAPSRDRLHCGGGSAPASVAGITCSGLLHETGSIAAICVASTR